MDVDLLRRDARSGAGATLRQPLARALGMGKGRGPAPSVLDACAGLGMDAWLMASLGCRVLAVERSAEVFRVGNEALERARMAQPDVAARITRHHGDSLSLLRVLRASDAERMTLIAEALGESIPAVIYLDPMFPLGRKTAEGKLLRWTRSIVGDDPDGQELLPAAFAVAGRRVVVKRPRRAAPLGGVTPTISHLGKGVRYDVYAVADARLRSLSDSGDSAGGVGTYD